MKKGNFFWISYGDLMTSLFFIMMVLFTVAIIKLQGVIDDCRETNRVNDEIFQELGNIQEALDGLNKDYYKFDSVNKRYKLIQDISFKPNSSDINDLSRIDKDSLMIAGNELFTLIHDLKVINENVDYLLIIEGNTQRTRNNYIENPDGGYRLSYLRALSLVNFWKENGLDFYQLAPQCEIIIAGSGYFGQSREENEQKNRNFTIQVTSKISKYLENVTKAPKE